MVCSQRPNRDVQSAKSQQLSESGVDVDTVAFEPSRACQALNDGYVESKTTGIQKKAVFDAAGIDSVVGWLCRHSRNLSERRRAHAKRLGEIVSRSAGDYAEANVGVGMQYCIGNVAACAIAT